VALNTNPDEDVPRYSMNHQASAPIVVLRPDGELFAVPSQHNCLPHYLQASKVEVTNEDGSHGRQWEIVVKLPFHRDGWRILFSEFEGDDLFQEEGMIAERKKFKRYMEMWLHKDGPKTSLGLNPPLNAKPQDRTSWEDAQKKSGRPSVYPESMLPSLVKQYRDEAQSGSTEFEDEFLLSDEDIKAQKPGRKNATKAK